MLDIQSGVPEIYRRGRRPALLHVEYGFRKVR
jgi:hypothetical protein